MTRVYLGITRVFKRAYLVDMVPVFVVRYRIPTCLHERAVRLHDKAISVAYVKMIDTCHWDGDTFKLPHSQTSEVRHSSVM